MTVKEKMYFSPVIRVVMLKTAGILCQSNGAFPLGDDETIERGNDDVWSENLPW